MQERTVNFGNDNSWEDLNIVFESLTIGSPEPQLVLIDVPFRNGPLDETDYFGDVKYKERKIEMSFLIPWWLDDQHYIYSEVQNRLNGQRKKVVFSADQDWYYEGRLQVGDLENDNGFFKFKVSMTADPYKYKDSVINAKLNNNTSTPLELKAKNNYMSTIPTITCSGNIVIKFGNNTIALSQGTHRSSGIIFRRGTNVMQITGANDVTIKVEYKQGRL